MRRNFCTALSVFCAICAIVWLCLEMSRQSSRYQRTPNASLFVRGLNLQSTGDDLKELFCRYGTVRDVYIPVDYHTREPRGFCYVEFEDVRDAEDALHYLDGTRLHGRELEIQYAEGDRKTPHQMRGKERGHGRYSRSPSPRRRRRHSRSPSPHSRSRSPRRSRSPYRSPSPVRSRDRRRHSRSNSRSRSRSPVARRRSTSRSPVYKSKRRSRTSTSHSPRNYRSPSRSYSRSLSRSRSYSRSP